MTTLSSTQINDPSMIGTRHLREDEDITSNHVEDDDKMMGSSRSNQTLTIAKIEDRAVTWLRLAMMLVLMASAIGVSLSAYYRMCGEEKEAFESQFESDAGKILESIGTNFDLTLGAADAFMYKLVSHAHHSNSTFPFVVLPDFPVQAAKLLSSSYAFWCSTFLYVAKEQKEEFETYMSKNLKWLDDSIQVQKFDPNYHGTIIEDYNITSCIIDNSAECIPDNSSGPFIVDWTSFPMIPWTDYGTIGWDAASDEPEYVESLFYCMEENKAVVAPPYGYVRDPRDVSDVEQAEMWTSWAWDFISQEDRDKGQEPLSDLFYPIIDNIANVSTDANYHQESPIGLLAFSFYWRESIRDILPTKSRGIIVVFETSCGHAFTYRVDGAKEMWLGAGDLHDSKYDHLGRSSLLSDLMGKDDFYTGVPIDTEPCPMSLSIYPSQDMEDIYVTSDPALYAFAASMIFIFTSVLFLVYDCIVSRRQHIIKKRAIASGAIVKSLFPEKVANQLVESEERNANNKKKDITSFLAKESSPSDLEMSGSLMSSSLRCSQPIADLYEETTIYFADLAGFTAWSSKRAPAEVFELLEMLYSSFDEIATRRHVFKVETIGDCYLACTGIPEPQDEHALIMVKFARDCMIKFREIINANVESFGRDTLDLQMRTGLHSGSTTAGVLRGEKGRFQLFGDTVNTASRMESYGVPGRIHISQDTADELTKFGKGHWLVPREDKIAPKGKGEMQTFFVTFQAKRTNDSDSLYKDNGDVDGEGLTGQGFGLVNITYV